MLPPLQRIENDCTAVANMEELMFHLLQRIENDCVAVANMEELMFHLLQRIENDCVAVATDGGVDVSPAAEDRE